MVLGCIYGYGSESVSSSVVSGSLWPQGLSPARLLCAWDSPGKNTGVGSHSLLQGIFPTQGSNRSLMLQADSLPSEPPGKPLVIQVRLWVWDRYCYIIARHFPSYLGAAFPVSSFIWNAICLDPPPVKILLIFQSSAKRPPFLRSLLKSCKSISHGFP